MALAQFLNRHVYDEALDASGWREVYEDLSAVLRHDDPLGVRDMGAPSDEYGPEALLFLALVLLGERSGDQLVRAVEELEELAWSQAPPYRALSEAAAQEALQHAYDGLFGGGYSPLPGTAAACLRVCVEHGIVVEALEVRVEP